MDPLSSETEASKEQATLPERVFLALAMVGICALCLIVTITVVSRAIYKPLIPDDVLIVREVMVVAILFPLAAVTASRAHIAVTIFSDWLGRRGKGVLSVLAHLVGVVFASGVWFAGWRLFAGAWDSGEYYDGDIYVPMWIGYGTFVGAFTVLVLRLVAMLFIDIKRLRQGG